MKRVKNVSCVFLFKILYVIMFSNVVECGNNNCGGRGVCMPIAQVYKLYTVGASNMNYTAWDGMQTTMCVCYEG